MDTPSWIYKEYALGRVSSHRLAETEKLAAGLGAGTAAMMIGTALASPILAAAGAKGAEKMMDGFDRLNFDRDLKKVLAVNPDIGKATDKQIRLAYQSIRTTNPKFSKDPLIAGTLLRQIMQNKVNPYDPKSPARVDLSIASQLAGSAGKGSREFVMQAAAESLGKLPGQMLQANSDLQEAAERKMDSDRRFDLAQKQFALKRLEHDNRITEFETAQDLKERQFAQDKHEFSESYKQKEDHFGKGYIQKERHFGDSMDQRADAATTQAQQFAQTLGQRNVHHEQNLSQRQMEFTQSQADSLSATTHRAQTLLHQQQSAANQLALNKEKFKHQRNMDGLKLDVDVAKLNPGVQPPPPELYRPGQIDRLPADFAARQAKIKTASSRTSLTSILRAMRSRR